MFPDKTDNSITCCSVGYSVVFLLTLLQYLSDLHLTWHERKWNVSRSWLTRSDTNLHQCGRGQSGRRRHNEPQLVRLLWIDVHHHFPPAFFRPLPKDKQKLRQAAVDQTPERRFCILQNKQHSLKQTSHLSPTDMSLFPINRPTNRVWQQRGHIMWSPFNKNLYFHLRPKKTNTHNHKFCTETRLQKTLVLKAEHPAVRAPVLSLCESRAGFNNNNKMSTTSEKHVWKDISFCSVLKIFFWLINI